MLIYGEGGLVLAPPSLEPQAREPWRWLRPPWEAPPLPPKPAVWQFLKEYIPPAMVAPEVQSWTEIYRMIAPHGSLLKDLLVPPTSQAEYYQEIVNTALRLGFTIRLCCSACCGTPLMGKPARTRKSGTISKDLSARPEPPAGETAVPGLPARMDGGGWPDTPFGDLRVTPRPPSRLWMSWTCFPLPNRLIRGARGGASGPHLDQSVSGQFFQLLAGLGEKVIMESCRYEAMLTGVRHQAEEIENLVSQWEQYFAGSSPSPPEPGEKPTEPTVEFNWDAVVGQNSFKTQQIQQIQAAAGDFLNENPDLAGDRHKVQMVVFCLKNYISLHPDNGALPFRGNFGPGRHHGPGLFPDVGEA